MPMSAVGDLSCRVMICNILVINEPMLEHKAAVERETPTLKNVQLSDKPQQHFINLLSGSKHHIMFIYHLRSLRVYELNH